MTVYVDNAGIPAKVTDPATGRFYSSQCGNNAIASLCSDLRKHPGTADHPTIEMTMLLAAGGYLDDPSALRKHIQGIQ